MTNPPPTSGFSLTFHGTRPNAHFENIQTSNTQFQYDELSTLFSSQMQLIMSVLVQEMAWYQTGATPFPESMMTKVMAKVKSDGHI